MFFRRRAVAAASLALCTLAGIASVALFDNAALAAGNPFATPAQRAPYAPGSATVSLMAASSSEVPAQADALVDSIGADARFGVETSAEGQNLARETEELNEIGIRHLRDGYYDLSPIYLNYFRNFAKHGIYHSIGFDLKSLTPEIVTTGLRAQMPYVDYVEVGNEWDNSGDPLWAEHLRAGQRMLYNTVRAHSEFNRVRVLAPGLESVRAHAAIFGAVPADAGNLHNATCDFEPSTTSRSVDTIALLAFAQPITPGKPIYTTETGYDNNPASSCYISPEGAAKYIPRTIAYRFNLGMPRNYFDYWSDESLTKQGFAQMGFVGITGIPKPQYRALQSFIALLADPGLPFRTKALRYAITGQTANVAHTLLQKRNGQYYLLIWLEVSSWSHNGRTPIAVAPQTVTLTFPGTVGGVLGYTYQPDWSLANTRLLSAFRHEIRLAVTDSVTIVRFGATD